MPNNLSKEQIDILKRLPVAIKDVRMRWLETPSVELIELKRAGCVEERGSYYRLTDAGKVALREAD